MILKKANEFSSFLQNVVYVVSLLMSSFSHLQVIERKRKSFIISSNSEQDFNLLLILLILIGFLFLYRNNSNMMIYSQNDLNCRKYHRTVLTMNNVSRHNEYYDVLSSQIGVLCCSCCCFFEISNYYYKYFISINVKNIISSMYYYYNYYYDYYYKCLKCFQLQLVNYIIELYEILGN